MPSRRRPRRSGSAGRCEPLGFFAQNPGWSVESQGGALAIYRSATRCKPEEIQPFIAEVDAVRRALARG